MQLVFLTALGVGSATVFGAILGLIFKTISHKWNDIVLGFAAGVMLAAAVIGLILPSLEGGGTLASVITVVGVFCGAFLLHILDKLVPHTHQIINTDTQMHKILLFVLAIAIHNFPEGIAAGVGFGTGNYAEAFTVAGGIALQNIPEGMVIIAPMLAAGFGTGKTFLAAASTGVIEVLGTMLGYFSVRISTAILPFALAFAGGTMLYVISDEMIPETHAHGNERGATYAFLAGFALMLAFDYLIG